MKNKLLITTAIVAIGLASNVWADTSYTATSSTYAVAPNGTIVNSEGSIVDLGKITYEEGTITTTLDLTDVSVSNEAGIKYGVLSNILTADEKSIIAGNVNIINGTISNNTSTGTGAVTLWVNSNYTGGALSHSITGTVFNNNTSARKGGALLIAPESSTISEVGTVELTNTTFTNNTSNAEAGAIYADKGTKITIDSSTFGGKDSGNHAVANGGAIYVSSASGVYSAAKVEITNSTFTENSADGNGGAIYNNGELEITNSEFTDNSANSLGGAIYNSGNITEITDSTFTGNTAGEAGGAIAHIEGTIDIINADFTNNSAGYIGGAIANNYDCIINEISGTFTNNYTTEEGEDVMGGAIYNEGIINSIKDSTFSGNSSELGGAISNYYGTIYFDGINTFATLSDTVYNTGRMTVNSGASIVNYSTITNTDGGTLTFADGSSYTFAYGSGLIDGDIYLGTNVTLNTIIASGTEDGSYDFVDGFVYDSTWIVGDNSLYDLSLNEAQNEMTIALKSTDEIASNLNSDSNQTSAAVAVVTGGTSDNENFNALAETINTQLQSSNSSDVAAALETLEKISADTTSAAKSTAAAGATAIANVVSGQFSGGSSNIASGDIFEKAAVWAKGVYSNAELDGSNGFDADSTGLAFGADKMVSDSVKLGAGYAYTYTEIDTTSRTTDVDTHTAFVYGEYKPNNWYINAVASYSWGDYEENAGVKKADYNVDTFALQSMTGIEINKCSYMITPEAGLRYARISQESYNDTLGSNISSDTSDVLTAVIGAKFSKNYELENNMVIRPEVKAAVTYDLFNDDANSVVTLANGSTYTTTSEALDEWGFEFGVGVTAEVSENVDITLSYEGKFRDDYADNSGIVNIKYNF